MGGSMKGLWQVLLCFTPAVAVASEPRVMPQSGIDPALLGQILFFDTSLSHNRSQSCATCHNQNAAFIDDRDNSAARMVSQGDNPHAFGKRNTLTMLYAKYSPPFHFDAASQQYIGGQFWDGRAADLAAQAGMPPLDPLEMGMPDKLSVVARLWQVPMYVELFAKHYGDTVWNEVDSAYGAMEKALAAFQTEKRLLAPFNAKYDRFLQGEYQLTPLEEQGRALFFDTQRTQCANCHQLQPTAGAKEETFSNYHYYNLGVPKNPRLIAHNKLPADFVDLGLFENPHVKGDERQKGKFKVPTLRNVAVTAPYMHNGVFRELRTVLQFLDRANPKRHLNPESGQPWGEPEYAATVEKTHLQAPPLTDQELDALEAFLKTLTDQRYEHLLN